ncbi:MAG TPA: preprotein translocase subunit SecG [Gammaproteobacteria bacterium]|jgi:preprotein translocase subunit SecG|nr:preprotein translocase subunit SecG [Gammaproteobacteria bacterium]
MLHSIVLVAHILVAMMIVGLVLLQRGKGAEAGTGFGAGASGTVFGARGSANFLSRATGVLATLFFITSLALAYLSTQRTAPASLLEALPAQQSPAPPAPAPAAPASELPQLPSDNGSASPGNAQPANPGSGNAPPQ